MNLTTGISCSVPLENVCEHVFEIAKELINHLLRDGGGGGGVKTLPFNSVRPQKVTEDIFTIFLTLTILNFRCSSS